ncbi:YhdP family protein [Rhodobacter ferrooxidans]|uniref:YhdP family protein n=1 Tax=Rhodobacter ferrooxidans TaxID=371731 RepID=UPI0002DC2B51|nr:AsmA-like C-terminal region-containing protein [Rhodobacter sp. SW2]
MWLLLSLALLAGGLGLGAMALTGRPIALPVWAVAEAEARLNRAMDGLGGTAVSVGEIEITVGRDWVPRLRLRDLVLARRDGVPILRLPEARLAVSPAALLQGDLRAQSLTLVGAQITIRRDAQGRFDLDLGAGVVGPQLDSFAALLDAVDAGFALPALSHLERIDAEALTLTLHDARAGRVWQVGDGRLTLENRAAELAMELGLTLVSEGQAPAQAVLNFVSQKASSEARIRARVQGVPARDIAAQAPPLAWLGVLDAPISGQLATSIDAGGGVSALEGTLTLAAGALLPDAAARPIAFDRAGLSLRYDPATRKIALSDVTVEGPSLRLNASGQIFVPGDGLAPAFLAQVRLEQVKVDPEGLFVEPVTFTEGAVDLRLRLDPFRLDLGQVTLVEGGRRLTASGHFAADAAGWSTALDLHLDAIRHDRLLALWPVSVVPVTRAWLAENLQQGLLFDVKAALRIAPGLPPRLSLGYEFADGDVKFLKTMPPIRNGYGYATIEGNSYTMVLDSGQVTPPEGGAIAMAGSVLSVLDILQKPPQAEIRLITDSSLTAALSLLDSPPFSFMSKAGRPVQLGQGRAQLDTVLRMQLTDKIRIDDVSYLVQGRLRDVSSDVLVPGRVLRAPDLSLTADRSGLQIAGKGTLAQVPFEVSYAQGFGAEAEGRSTVTGWVELSPRTVKAFTPGLPEGMVGGAGMGEVALDLRRGEATRLTLTSDLRGLVLKLPEVGWSKPAARPGKLTVQARLTEPVVIDRLDLEGPGLKATGAISLRADGRLDKANFDMLDVGGWLKAGVLLTGQGAGRAVTVALTGGDLDLRRMTLGSGSGTGPSSPVQVALDRVAVSDSITLTGVTGDFSARGGFNGSFRAAVNGVAPVSGTVVPTDAGSAVRITSRDAGAVLKAAGIFDNARGGTLDLQLVPRGPEGIYDGTAKAANLRVRNAPALAELLSAISVVGILEQLNDTGLVFNEAEARFRLTPDAIELTRGSAVGASLGVSMAGLYEFAGKRLDMQGVISPLYLLNGLGAVFTRRGEGLFGFSYRLRGTSDVPKVSVNPLSILTPGMFRELFRAAPPKIGDQP